MLGLSGGYIRIACVTLRALCWPMAMASTEASRPREHEQHDRLCADVARAVEGCVAREAVVLIYNSLDNSISRHRIGLHELRKLQ
jgi:hypothetical protein